MARREQFVNDADTTLNGAITSTATSITVADGSVFPSSGDYRLLCESEVLLVTARSTNVLTVERGVDGTTAITHSDAAAIAAVLTAGALEQMMDDVYGGVTGRYPFRILDQSGNTLTSSDFTWVNQGTATVADDTWGGITLTIPNAANDSMRILKITAPSTPWTCTGYGLFGPGYNDGGGASSSYFAILTRESDTGKLQSIEARISDYIRVRRYNSATSYNAEDASQAFAGNRVWLQIEDDGTTLYFRNSSDGINFYTLYSVARATFLTSAGPDEIGFLWNSGGGKSGQVCHTMAWILE